MRKNYLLMLVALMAFAPLGALAQNDADSYPIESVRWDKVPAENREVMEQLFADMVLVPEGEGVKKFYISAHEVQSGLWTALMGEKEPVISGPGQITIGEVGECVKLYADGTTGGESKDTASVADIQQFITLLRKQTEYLVHVGHVEIAAQAEVLRPPVVAPQEGVNVLYALLARSRIAQVAH